MIGQYLMLLCEEVIIPCDLDLGTEKHGNFDPIKFVSTLLTGHMADRLSCGI